MGNFKVEKFPEEIANRLYDLGCDMDFADYEEEKEKELKELEDALHYLKAICENEYNQDYFRTFYKALERI